MAARWVDVGGAEAVEADQPFTAELGGVPIIVVRCEAGYFAVEDRCTHDGEALAGGEIDTEGCRIVCPRHGAQFCLRSGQALTPPAYEPVRTFAVRAENGRILIELPE